LTDTPAVGIINKTADNFMTSGNAVLGFEVIKYLRSEILVHKNSSKE
jgi:hypothetical protein